MTRLRGHLPLLALATVLVGIMAVAVWALVSQPSRDVYLHPDSVGADGSRAIARVLGQRGVDVSLLESAAALEDLAGRDRTLFIVEPGPMDAESLHEVLAVAEDVVILQPDSFVLDDLDAPVQASGAKPAPGAVAPGCDVAAASAAGPIDVDGQTYELTGAQAQLCYFDPQAAQHSGTVARYRTAGTTVTVIGTDRPFTNAWVGQKGVGTLGLWLLGQHPEVSWWRVSPTDPAFVQETHQDPRDLQATWLEPARWWLIVVAGLAMWWRGRRFGPLVAEPLPVVVRSAETARGRAALYRQARARDQAGTILRADATRRIARRLGLPASTPAAQVAVTVAEHTGVPAATVGALLAGQPPASDQELVRLAGQLDQLHDSLQTSTLPVSQQGETGGE
ncbi:MAG: hypothetical protein CSA58_11840 [Micrococcales bacterium]|nr:MAG: hypothetical protein CSB46_00435 [Micrococcales bacterium]PIE25988.1 MAG: hypothetical protein CSA58_11840 [Micrococcales bacterium]